MKCISCEVDINPKWKYAIDKNICPFCGSNIMEEHLKNLLSSLADVMDKLQQYPAQLNDWLLSNYNFIKTDSDKLIEFLPKEDLNKYVEEVTVSEKLKEFEDRKDKKFTVKVKTDAGEQEVEAEKIQEEERTNEFFKRAEAVKPNIDGFRSTAEKTEHLKRLALQIKRAGSTSIVDESGENEYISPEMLEDADPEAVAEMGSLFSGNEISSSLNNSLGDEDEIPSVVLNMANSAKGSRHTSNPADMIKLQQLQNRLQDSRRNFESGNARGKGGFSRV
jgi:hypothetical protein